MRSSGLKNSGSSSLVKSIILIVVLIVALFLMRIMRSDLPEKFTSMYNFDAQSYRNIVDFTKDEVDSLKRKFAGFWVYHTEDSLAPVQKWDHLEVLDNGIIWQVQRVSVTYPSGDVSTTYNVRTAYFEAFGKVPQMHEIACNARVIRQVFINGTDTCRGESQVDELWEANYSNGTFMLNQREYKIYDGEIVDFFPEGMISLVDTINIGLCDAQSNMSYFLKKDFVDKSESIKSGYKTLDYGKIIDTYYVPALIDELFMAGSISKPSYDSISVRFSVSPNGAVSNPKVVGKMMSYDKFTDVLLNDLETWILPQYVTTESSKQVEHVFYFNK